MDAKTTYAQSSDIKSRTYLEYRRDMKRKAIAELEIMPFLQARLTEVHHDSTIKVEKAGGDKFLWFLRKGGVSREPDFIYLIGGEKRNIEFQYADREDLAFYDFKISKVVKRVSKEKLPLLDRDFFYIHKLYKKYALFTPNWVIENGQIGMVEAWRSQAYRVPKDKFESILICNIELPQYIDSINAKNNILEFQHELLSLYRENLSSLLQIVIDENKLVQFVPKDLESFFKVCFILDNIGKVPVNGNLWLVYLLSFLNENLNLDQLAKIVYCLDFIYSKIELSNNELAVLRKSLLNIREIGNSYYKQDGSYTSSSLFSSSYETRCALFIINLLEDLNQDMTFYYNQSAFIPITKIYENVPDCMKISAFISSLS